MVHLFSKTLAAAVGGGHFHSCDLGDEGEHGLDSQLGDSHDEGFTAGLHLPLQLLLTIYLYHDTVHLLGLHTSMASPNCWRRPNADVGATCIQLVSVTCECSINA